LATGKRIRLPVFANARFAEISLQHSNDPILPTNNLVERSDVLKAAGGLRIAFLFVSVLFSEGSPMKKLLLIGIIGAVALVAVAKKTNVCSYATTLASTVSDAAQDQIPTKFELERIRNEIVSLDDDISAMIRPIAEYKVVVEKMRKDIARNQTRIDEQKKTMLGVIEDLAAKKEISVHGVVYTPERVRQQLQRDTNELKQLEKRVRVQHQVLEAKEKALVATQEQLAKVVAKKREYEVRLAQLQAEEETLQVARIGTTVKIDNTRATQIEEALNGIEHRLQVAREQASMYNGTVVNIPLQDRTTTGPVDVNAIRGYLEGNATEESKTVSNK